MKEKRVRRLVGWIDTLPLNLPQVGVFVFKLALLLITLLLVVEMLFGLFVEIGERLVERVGLRLGRRQRERRAQREERPMQRAGSHIPRHTAGWLYALREATHPSPRGRVAVSRWQLFAQCSAAGSELSPGRTSAKRAPHQKSRTSLMLNPSSGLKRSTDCVR